MDEHEDGWSASPGAVAESLAQSRAAQRRRAKATIQDGCAAELTRRNDALAVAAVMYPEVMAQRDAARSALLEAQEKNARLVRKNEALLAGIGAALMIAHLGCTVDEWLEQCVSERLAGDAPVLGGSPT